MQSAIDQNDRGTMLAQNDTTGLTERWRVDPILNALEVFLVTDDGLTGTSLPNARIDSNDRPTLLGLNDTTGLTECWRCDVNGVLKIKV